MVEGDLQQERAVFDLCTEELRDAQAALIGKHGVTQAVR